MVWTEEHEELLLREILTYEPFNYKHGTVPRGEAWKMIAETLNGLIRPKFSVTQRSVREKYTTLEKEHKKKMSDEEKASGINPEDLTSREQALEEIIQRFADIEVASEQEKQKSEKERQTAVEMRQQAMETHAETRKRNSTDESPTSSAKKGKSRRSSDETVKYLRDKMQVDKEFRERELQIAETRENTMQQLILQQQQQNQAMLALLLKHHSEKNGSSH